MKKKIMLDFMLVVTAAVLLLTVLFAVVTCNLFEQRVSETLALNAHTLTALIESGAQRETIIDALADELRVTLPDLVGWHIGTIFLN